MAFKFNIKDWYLYFGIIGFIIFVILICFIKSYFKRITNINMLPKNIRGIILRGIVKSIPDGDGFRFFHIPFFRSKDGGKNRKNWLPIRIAGIDAPEMACFGNVGQKGAKEAKEFLKYLIFGKMVKIKILKLERYDRLLCRVYIIKGLRSQDLAVKMLKKGHACVYIGSDAEYDGKYEKYCKLEKIAKKQKIGMWKYNQISPMEYKKNLRQKNGIK